MKRKISSKSMLVYVFCLAALMVFTFTLSKQSKNQIRLHDDQIDVQVLTNAIATFIIEKGYGYEVELIECTIKEVRELLVKGDVDVTLEMWKENNLLWFDNALRRGVIKDLGILYDGGQQYWIVSKWYADKKGIKTVFDMQHHWRDFIDPNDPSKGLFFNCIFGWACQDINQVKLQAYGLHRYYNTISPLSPEALKSIYENSLISKIPVFGYYWEPNDIMRHQDWHILEEPPYSQETWIPLMEAATGSSSAPVEKACAFNHSGVYKVAASSLARSAPDVLTMLEKMNIEAKLLSEILFNQGKHGTGRERLYNKGLVFLQKYPEKWKAWVTPEAAEKIDKALKNLDSGT